MIIDSQNFYDRFRLIVTARYNYFGSQFMTVLRQYSCLYGTKTLGLQSGILVSLRKVFKDMING
jgi:hypothetical protein